VGSDTDSLPAEQPNQTNVMVIVGATDDRIEALRRGNAPETAISASSNVSTSEVRQSKQKAIQTNPKTNLPHKSCSDSIVAHQEGRNRNHGVKVTVIYLTASRAQQSYYGEV